MRYRIWAVLAMAVLAIGLSSCTASRTIRPHYYAGPHQDVATDLHPYAG